MHLLSFYGSRCKYIWKGELLKMKTTNDKMVVSLTIVAVTAILSIMICCLAALGYKSRMWVEKEKIEVNSDTDFNQNTTYSKEI